MKTTLKLLAILFAACSAANAQVAPAATTGGAYLNYAMRYSQTAVFSTGTLGNSQNSVASGNLEYMNGDVRLPFSMNFGGGYSWNLSGTPYEVGFFENFLISQGLVGRNWRLLLSDDASYLPEAPTTGFSGVPGTGEPIGGSGTTSTSSQSILTVNTHVIENFATATYEHSFNAATTLSVGGNSELLRYPDGNGLDTTAETGSAVFARYFNARNLLSGEYLFSQYSYPNNSSGTFTTNSALLAYQRQWSRKLTTNASVGPQWISGSNSSIVPSSTNVVAMASIIYKMQFASAVVNYNHGANGGGGYQIGADTDTVQGNFTKEFGRDVTIGLAGGYLRTVDLNSNGVTTGNFGGAQATWRIGQKIIIFADYTGTEQSSSSALPANALNQLLQNVAFGIGYSPRVTHLRQ
jgi:hypothetical protein